MVAILQKIQGQMWRNKDAKINGGDGKMAISNLAESTQFIGITESLMSGINNEFFGHLSGKGGLASEKRNILGSRFF
jgi:hypothetical protein